MANRGDVDLVIRAKDQAKKAIDSVADALHDLTAAQNEAGQSASKTDGLMARLGSALKDLDRETKGLAAFNKIATQLDKAADAVGRLDASVGKAEAEVSRLTGQTEASAAATAKLRQAADEAAAAYAKQKAAVAGLTAEEKKSETTVRDARARRDALKAAMQQAAEAANVAERAERALQKQLAAATGESERASTAFREANTELEQIAVIANQASAALGGVEATQEAVAAASARAAADMERLNAAMARQTGGTVTQATPTSAAGATAAYRAQVAAVDQAKAAWREAQVEANKLGAAIAATENPTREQATAFLLAQAASRQAKQEYIAQGVALNQLRAGLSSARTATQATTQAVTQSGAAAGTAATQYRSWSAAAGQAVPAQNTAAASGFRLRDAFTGIYGESRKSMNLFQRLRGEVLSLAAAYVGLYAIIGAIGGVVTAFTSLEAAQSRLGVVFNQNTARVGVEISWLRAEAQRLGVAFSGLSDEYSKFAFAARDVNFSNQETRRTFTALAEAGRVMRVSQQDMAGLFKALTQIMSKGKVQAEELRGQIGDRMSGAFQIFAAALGMTSAELDKAMEKGEVLANKSTMLKFADRLTKVFGPQLASSLESTSAEMGRFTNNIEQAQLRVGAGGFMEGFTEALRDMNVWFQSDDGKRFFDEMGAALGRVMQIIPGIIQNLDKFVLLFQIFAALKIGQVFMGLIGGITGMSGVMVKARHDVMALSLSLNLMAGGMGPARGAVLALSGAVTAMRGVMIAGAATARALWIAIGGLPGLIMTGLAFLISSMAGKWLTNIDMATEALSQHAEIVDKVRSAYVEAGGDVDNWHKKIKDLNATEIEISTRKLTEALSKTHDETLKVLQKDYWEGFFDQGDADGKLADLIERFRAGKVSATAFRIELDKLAQANPRLDRNLIAPLTEAAKKEADLELAIKKGEAALRAHKGAATAADIALLDLAGAADTVNASLDTTALDAYTAAMKRLGDAVPDIKMQTDLDDKRKAIEKSYTDAIVAAKGDFKKIGDAFLARNAALQALDNSYTGGSASYASKLVSRESGGDRNARPRLADGSLASSAAGKYQFTEGTWLGLFKEAYPQQAKTMSREAILKLRLDDATSQAMFDLLTEKNIKLLVDAGFAPTDTNKYLLHFLGGQDGLDVLRANRDAPGTSLTSLVNANSIKANPAVFNRNKTAADLVGWSANKMGTSAAQVDVQQRVVDLVKEAEERQKKYNSSIEAGVSERQFEIEQMGRTSREQQIQAALREASLKAQADEVVMSDAQVLAIRNSVGALYDKNEAERAGNAIIEAQARMAEARGERITREAFITQGLTQAKVNGETAYGKELAKTLGLEWDLIEAKRQQVAQQEKLDGRVSSLRGQRDELMQMIEFYTTQGDTGMVAQLQQQLAGVNAELLLAIDNAIAFYKALDPATNPNAAATILNLQNMKLGMQQVSNQVVITKKQMIDLGVQAGTNAFDVFVQKIAEGKNALQALGDAFRQFAIDFLRQLGQMIIQQLILNALRSIFGSDTSSTAVAGAQQAGTQIAQQGLSSIISAGVRHKGGPASGPGPRRNVMASVFADATRYHGGGIAGLKPGEVPIIAEKKEGIFTEEQMAAMGSGGATQTPSVSMKTVNVFDPVELLRYALADSEGEKLFVNFIRNNKDTVNAAIGGSAAR